MAPNATNIRLSSVKPTELQAVPKKINKPNHRLNTEDTPKSSRSQQTPEKVTNQTKPKLKQKSNNEITHVSERRRHDAEPRQLFSERNETALHAIRWQLERLHENVTAVLQYHQFKRQGNRPNSIAKFGSDSTAQAVRPVRRAI